MSEAEFWLKRYYQQWDYIEELRTRSFHWEGRQAQLLDSAFEVLELIVERLETIQNTTYYGFI